MGPQYTRGSRHDRHNVGAPHVLMVIVVTVSAGPGPPVRQGRLLGRDVAGTRVFRVTHKGPHKCTMVPLVPHARASQISDPQTREGSRASEAACWPPPPRPAPGVRSLGSPSTPLQRATSARHGACVAMWKRTILTSRGRRREQIHICQSDHMEMQVQRET